MKASIEKEFKVPHSIEKVWDYLSNPEKIVTCVPGAQITEVIDEKNFKGIVSMKFGPVSVKYNGEITMEKIDNENHEMSMVGNGFDSKGKGSASMTMKGKLKTDGEETIVNYSTEVSVTGMLAQFGSRLIGDVSNQLAEQFVNNFKNKLDNPDNENVEGDTSLNAASMVGNIVKNKLGGIFRKGDKEG